MDVYITNITRDIKNEDPSRSRFLPLVLLGFWTANRSDSVFDVSSGLNTIGLLRLLKGGMPKLNSPAPTYHAKTVAGVPSSLESYTHILIRMDASRRPLQPPLEGSFEFFEWRRHHYSLNVGNTVKVVSLARLKPPPPHSDLQEKI